MWVWGPKTPSAHDPSLRGLKRDPTMALAASRCSLRCQPLLLPDQITADDIFGPLQLGEVDNRENSHVSVVRGKVAILLCRSRQIRTRSMISSPRVHSELGARGQAARAQRWSKLSSMTAARMTNMRSAPGRDQCIPGPVGRALNCLQPLSTVPEPMG